METIKISEKALLGPMLPCRWGEYSAETWKVSCLDCSKNRRRVAYITGHVCTQATIQQAQTLCIVIQYVLAYKACLPKRRRHSSKQTGDSFRKHLDAVNGVTRNGFKWDHLNLMWPKLRLPESVVVCLYGVWSDCG